MPHHVWTPMLRPADEMRALNRYWRWFLALGIGMIALGTFAIGWACIATLTVTAT